MRKMRENEIKLSHDRMPQFYLEQKIEGLMNLKGRAGQVLSEE